MDVPVLHLVNRFWIGGAERQVVERLRLHPPGFAAVVGCLELSGPMLDQVRALGHEPVLFPLRGSMARANTLEQVARVAALIREQRVRIVHATDFNTNLIAQAAGRLAGASVIVSRVDLGHLREGFGRWHRRVEKWNARHADVVVANAEAVREVCIREEGCRPERVVVVRNGIDLPRFDRLASHPLQAPLPLEPDDMPVAVIGNLWPVKGHRTLVEAAALLTQRLPRVKFLCAGEGPEREVLEKRIRELVRPGENGLLVPYGDPGSLADKLVELFSDEERAAQMGRRGRARVEAELTLSRMAEGYGAVYRHLLGGARAPQAALSPQMP